MAQQTKGRCLLCDKYTTRAGMTRHFPQCIGASADAKDTHNALLVIAYAGPYWIYFEVPETATLKDVDSFLRDIWLECCGHLSMFRIGEELYDVQPSSDFGPPNKNMDCFVKDILEPGMNFSHEYDFGTTTELGLTALGRHETKSAREGKVRLLARNDAPEMFCSKCEEKEASSLCSFCGMGYMPFCDACATAHEEKECEEGGMLPVVNSPRTGQCAYGEV